MSQACYRVNYGNGQAGPTCSLREAQRQLEEERPSAFIQKKIYDPELGAEWFFWGRRLQKNTWEINA